MSNRELVIVGLNALPEDAVAMIDYAAASHSYIQDKGFEYVLPPDQAKRGVVRLLPSISTPASIGENASHMEETTTVPHLSSEHKRIVADLEDRLVALVEEEAIRSRIVPDGDLLEVMNVGSTSRGTYVKLPVDFDVTVVTSLHGADISVDAVRLLLERMVPQIQRCPEYVDFCSIAELHIDGQLPDIVVGSVAMDGPRSLVGRLFLRHESDGRTVQSHLLDLSLGLLFRSVGYERWIRSYMNMLGPSAAEMLRNEVRRTKELLSRTGTLYGAANHGFRGFLVEQLIIQMHAYRSSPSHVGTVVNAFRLIYEESILGQRSMEQFTSEFPLWHPGVWWSNAEYRTEFPEHNLWEVLGDGNQEIAESHWRALQQCAVKYIESIG